MEIGNIKYDNDTLLIRINRTLELIRMFEKGIQLSQSIEGVPKSLILQDEEMKARLLKELVDLLAEMNIHVALKTAA